LIGPAHLPGARTSTTVAMRALSTPATRDKSLPTPERLARAWAHAVSPTSYVATSQDELATHLIDLAARLLMAARAEPFDPKPAQEVGKALVAAHFTQPEALDRSLSVLGTHLNGCPLERLSALQGAFAAGYTRALRELVLAEQEQIQAAAMQAQVEAEKARWASEARFRAVFASSAVGIGIADTEGNILDVNQALCDMLGYAPEELRSRRVSEFVHSEDTPGVAEYYRELIHGERDHFRVEKPYFNRDGQVVWTDLVVSLIRDQHGGPRFVVAMVEDVTERHLLQIRLRHQALHDPLTQLPNRTLLFERLARVFDNPDTDVRVGLCYLDVDGFNVINDTLGHDIGDHLLVAVARRLHTAVADPDTMVARVGGDEFVVLVEGSKGTQSVVDVAEQALAAVRAPVRLGAHEVTVSASAGVVERAVRGTSAAELMKAADTTLSWAKSDGKNCLALFDADRHALEVTRYQLSASMPAALERGEFFVEYQPLVRLRDATVIGVEALVRWHHPHFGLLGPDNFIGLAEETGLIVPLGRWVLTEACRQAARWRKAHPDRELISSVNIAVRQVRDPGIVQQVSEILDETGLDPSALQLELTESDVMGSAGEPLDTLYALADLGVRIAIDDFGTGYSNLAYLRRLPVHSLKLAGSFVAGLRSAKRPDRVDQEIVATLIKLAHTLNLTVTAEGVETAQQAARLRAMWCDTAQGWYYAQPGPAAAMDQYLA
jgi:diguanylate cyclase (GGDEF)-like protein/PAS domain S-box-containing protein